MTQLKTKVPENFPLPNGSLNRNPNVTTGLRSMRVRKSSKSECIVNGDEAFISLTQPDYIRFSSSFQNKSPALMTCTLNPDTSGGFNKLTWQTDAPVRTLGEITLE